MKNKLLNLFRANANAGGRFEIKGEGESAVIYVYDAIGAWYGVDSLDFVKAVAGLDGRPLHVRVNSPGGDVFEARAMQTALAQYPGKVTAHIDGVAASAAAFLVMGADEIEAAEGSFLMIHKAWTVMPGNAAELRAEADLLDQIDATIITDFANRTGLDRAEVEAMMDAETWLNANDALKKGFIDSVFVGSVSDSSKWDFSAYANAPAALTERAPVDPARTYDRAALERRLDFIRRTAR